MGLSPVFSSLGGGCSFQESGCCLFWGLFVLEPGYYEDGAFGIRIENVVLVVPVKTKVSIYLLKNNCSLLWESGG